LRGSSARRHRTIGQESLGPRLIGARGFQRGLRQVFKDMQEF
jgi:hypothetical protein